MSVPSALPVPFPNSYWVVPSLVLAGEHPAEADLEVFTTRLASLLDVGIRTFIDLTEPQDLGEDCAVMAAYRRLLKSLANDRGLEITQVNIPIPDFNVPSVATMRCILDVIDRSVADRNPVFVHCLVGLGRTGTAVGCYLKRHGLATDEDVMDQIAELRKVIAEDWGPSPHMPKQAQMVKGWRAGE